MPEKNSDEFTEEERRLLKERRKRTGKTGKASKSKKGTGLVVRRHNYDELEDELDAADSEEDSIGYEEEEEKTSLLGKLCDLLCGTRKEDEKKQKGDDCCGIKQCNLFLAVMNCLFGITFIILSWITPGLELYRQISLGVVGGFFLFSCFLSIVWVSVCHLDFEKFQDQLDLYIATREQEDEVFRKHLSKWYDAKSGTLKELHELDFWQTSRLSRMNLIDLESGDESGLIQKDLPVMEIRSDELEDKKLSDDEDIIDDDNSGGTGIPDGKKSEPILTIQKEIELVNLNKENRLKNVVPNTRPESERPELEPSISYKEPNMRVTKETQKGILLKMNIHVKVKEKKKVKEEKNDPTSMDLYSQNITFTTNPKRTQSLVSPKRIQSAIKGHGRRSSNKSVTWDSDLPINKALSSLREDDQNESTQTANSDDELSTDDSDYETEESKTEEIDYYDLLFKNLPRTFTVKYRNKMEQSFPGKQVLSITKEDIGGLVRNKRVKQVDKLYQCVQELVKSLEPVDEEEENIFAESLGLSPPPDNFLDLDDEIGKLERDYD